ncbi:hypothetical protein ACHAWU_004267 [Discostella pseudostelligera]|uniref:Chitin-binding type-2 domain-containing protein n=1 Tax=Discostella pseudostelligera TaxID=259834 RepID=A0ABD3M7Z0_9STRA
MSMRRGMNMKAIRCMSFAASCIYLSQIHRASNAIAQDVAPNNNTDPDTPCANGYSGNQAIPSTGCRYYYACWEGVVQTRIDCGEPLLFDNVLQYCNFPSDVCCPGVTHEFCPGFEGYGFSSNSSESPIDPTSEGVIETQPSESNSNSQPMMSPSADAFSTTTPPTSEAITIQVPGPILMPSSSSPNSSPTTPTTPETITIQAPGSILTSMFPSSIAPTTIIAFDLGSESPTALPSISFSDSPSIYGSAILHIESKRELIEKYVLRSYYHGDAELAYPSTIYTYEPFMQSLQTMGVDGFGADFKFNLWEGGAKYHYGLVNLAAFLANCMVESIEADTCDELNWQHESGRHAISNACGQESRSYQDETCDTSDDIFSCEVVTSVQITASSNSSESSAPPPFQCKPGSGEGYYSGYWDAPNGPFVPNTEYSNDLGRTDTEGCCFWGRGALLTRGVCNIGKLNYYLGKKGADLGNNTLYPTVDFCRFPEAPCAGTYTQELRWIVALFEWAERVQRYTSPNEWQFDEKLIEFVDNGMIDDTFIDSVSRILSRGCHEYGCSELEARMLERRRSNFYLIINDIFDMKALLNLPNAYPSVYADSSPPPPSSESHTNTGDAGQPIYNTDLSPSSTLQSSSPINAQSPNSSPKNELIGLEGNDGSTIHRNRKALIALTGFSAAFILLLM